MAPRQPLNDEQRRLLRITARMPLASVNNLASVMETTEDQVRGMLGRLRSGGWVASVMRGMTERRQHRFFLTGQAVDLLYTTDHQHPSPREEARGRAGTVPPAGRTAPGLSGTFALDHDHPVHLESQERFTFQPARSGRGWRATAPTTSTRRGPQRRGAWRCPCAGWPCWSRSTAWPRTSSGAAGSACPPVMTRSPAKPG